MTLQKTAMGRRNHLAGLAAEDQVQRSYAALGAQIKHQRWRKTGGEADLIVTHDDILVFVEVKKSKTHAQAMSNWGHAQQMRLMNTAFEYLALHDLPQDTDMRFDLATVDATGKVDILENAVMQ